MASTDRPSVDDDKYGKPKPWSWAAPRLKRPRKPYLILLGCLTMVLLLIHRTQGGQRSPHSSTNDRYAYDKLTNDNQDVEQLSIDDKVQNLPEFIYIPFEAAIADTNIEGWEDDWIAHAHFDSKKWQLKEPKIDFVYLWVNGSEDAFRDTKRLYEESSILNDLDGSWISSHGVNRYRDWDELRYSIRSIEQYALMFLNKIQIVVNSVAGSVMSKQVPIWLKNDPITRQMINILKHEDIVDEYMHSCLPSFNSLTIENQLFNTPSNTDHMFAMSDDMLLGRPHAASDIYSPLFGPNLGFRRATYNTEHPPNDEDAQRFGEKPPLVYSSWLLNRRFGFRERRVHSHFGHSLSRSVMREAIGSFPGPELQSACVRFRGEYGFQLYSWFIYYHYLIERHREAMLWSYVMVRADEDGDGYLDWRERQAIIEALKIGMLNEADQTFRRRSTLEFPELLRRAGLQSPEVNNEVQWTSNDGPVMLKDLECSSFDLNSCLGPGFSIPDPPTWTARQNPMFSTALIFDRLARQNPSCGDCLLKLLLNQVPKGLSPILPHKVRQSKQRKIIVKALMRYKYTISEQDALFVMVTHAGQIDRLLFDKYVKNKQQMVGQLCLNDDVSTEDETELADIQRAVTELYQGLFPKKSRFEV